MFSFAHTPSATMVPLVNALTAVDAGLHCASSSPVLFLTGRKYLFSLHGDPTSTYIAFCPDSTVNQITGSCSMRIGLCLNAQRCTLLLLLVSVLLLLHGLPACAAAIDRTQQPAHTTVIPIGQPRNVLAQLQHVRRWRVRRKLQFDALVQQARDEIPTHEEAPGCSTRVGIGYLERWRKLRGDYCTPGGTPATTTTSPNPYSGPPLPPPPFGSMVRCNIHPAVDLTTCLASNMVIDGAAFIGPAKADDEMPAAARESVKLGCNVTQPVESFLRGRLRNEGPRRFVVDAAALVPAEQVALPCAGAAAVQHAVVFVTRVDGSNAFHNAGALGLLFAFLGLHAVPARVCMLGLVLRMGYPHLYDFVHRTPDMAVWHAVAVAPTVTSPWLWHIKAAAPWGIPSACPQYSLNPQPLCFEGRQHGYLAI